MILKYIEIAKLLGTMVCRSTPSLHLDQVIFVAADADRIEVCGTLEPKWIAGLRCAKYGRPAA